MSRSLTRKEFLKVAGGLAVGLAASRGGLDAFSQSTRKPNVLLIVMDTVRAKSMSLYGYERPTTPELEKLSQQGVLFQTAITPCSWTLPAHASMFTGQWPYKLSTHYITPLDKTYPVLAEVFDERGYRTAGFVANNFYCSREFGLSRGFRHYEDYRLTLGQMVLSEALTNAFTRGTRIYDLLATYHNFGRKSADLVNQGFLNWVDRQSSGQPFFAFLNYFDAHDPYLDAPEFEKKYGLKRPYGSIEEGIRDRTEEALNELQRAYHGAIEYVDQQIGNLIQALAQRGILDHTLVIITADHGESLGEHGMLGHGNSLYLDQLQVPLLVIQPGQIPPGKTITTPVSLRSIPATILEAAGLPNGRFPGRSLRRYWQEDAEDEEILYSHTAIEDEKTTIYRFSLESIYYQGFHFIQPYQQNEELYDIRADPEELINLAGDPKYHEVLTRYRGYRKTLRDS